jgi:hypothetical protein
MRSLLSGLPRPLVWLATGTIALAWLFTPLRALALEVTPAELDFSVATGERSTDNLELVNNEGQAQDYRIYPDDAYQDWFTISPDEVLLAPGQRAEIEITVAPPADSHGEYTAFIYITSAEPADGLQVNLGVKIQAEITVRSRESGWWKIFQDNPLLLAAVIGGLTAIIVGVVVWRRRRRYDYRDYRGF